MLKIRLKKVGRKRVNAFRIIVVDSRSRRDTGNFIQDLGYYKPQHEQMYLSMNLILFNSWVSKGAQITERIAKLAKIATENPQYVRVCSKN